MKYILNKDRFEHKSGTIVYLNTNYDYGCSSDEERYTGIEHVSVKLDESNDSPFFTVPKQRLDEVIV